jgi:hypothetical protein
MDLWVLFDAYKLGQLRLSDIKIGYKYYYNLRKECGENVIICQNGRKSPKYVDNCVCQISCICFNLALMLFMYLPGFARYDLSNIETQFCIMQRICLFPTQIENVHGPHVDINFSDNK